MDDDENLFRLGVGSRGQEFLSGERRALRSKEFRLTKIEVSRIEEFADDRLRTARSSRPSLHLAELESVDDIAVGEGVGDDDLPASGLAPLPGFQGIEGVGDRLLGIV